MSVFAHADQIQSSPGIRTALTDGFTDENVYRLPPVAAPGRRFYLKFSVTVLAVCPSTVSVTMTLPAPRRDFGSGISISSMPIVEPCGPAYATGSVVDPIWHKTAGKELRPRMPVPNNWSTTWSVAVPRSIGMAEQLVADVH